MSDGKFVSIERLKSFIECNNQINCSYDDVNAMLVSVLKLVMAFICCESCSVLIYNRKSNNLLVSLGPAGLQIKHIDLEDGSIASWVIEHRQTVVINNPAGDQRFFANRPISSRPRNMLASPLVYEEDCLGIIEVFNQADRKDFDNDDVALLELLGKQIGTSYKKSEIYRQKCDLISSCQTKNTAELRFVKGHSAIIQDIEKIVGEIAKTNTSVLISGERGSGKSVFAYRLHMESERWDEPFVKVNCVSKSSELLEKEIFGHFESGVYKNGALAESKGGTLFLDEVGNLPPGIQDRLYGVLQEKRYRPFDGADYISCDARIVASTSKNLESMVKNQLFRENLYYLLNVLPMNIPPLRKHTEDIFPLAQYFLEYFSRENKKKIEGFSSEVLELLTGYEWPGNISELKNSVEQACIRCSSVLLGASDFVGLNSIKNVAKEKNVQAQIEVSNLNDDKTLKTALNEFKKEYIKKILKEQNWNQTATARVLDVQRTYVSKLIADLGISRDEL